MGGQAAARLLPVLHPRRVGRLPPGGKPGRHLHLEREWPEVQDVAVGQGRAPTYRLAVDACAAAAVAVAHVDAIGRAEEKAVEGGDIAGFQAEVTPAGATDRGHVAVERPRSAVA